MSKNKLTPLEVVERYHGRYIEYEKAFSNNPFNEEELQKQLKKIVESNIDTDSDEFMDKMIDIVIEKPQKRADVNNAAFKFCLYTDFYLLTQEEELPEEILKDYNALPIKDSIKTFFSIKNGEFVKNEKEEVSDEMRLYFKKIVAQVNVQ